jgi:hypothetical protein
MEKQSFMKKKNKSFVEKKISLQKENEEGKQSKAKKK